MKDTTERPRTRMPNVKVDWISRLPDELLILVLSFLTTKEAVQTCILSKRRRRVWVPLERDILNCRNLKNMKVLLIGMFGVSFDFNLLALFLKLFPNVEKLVLVIDVSRIAIHEEHMQEVLGDVSFQHKYIELVIIRDWHRRELPEVLIKTIRKTLNAYVKEIGNVVIE